MERVQIQNTEYIRSTLQSRSFGTVSYGGAPKMCRIRTLRRPSRMALRTLSNTYSSLRCLVELWHCLVEPWSCALRWSSQDVPTPHAAKTTTNGISDTALVDCRIAQHEEPYVLSDQIDAPGFPGFAHGSTTTSVCCS